MPATEERPIASAGQRNLKLEWRRTVQEFLWLPLVLTAAFILLGVATVVFEAITPRVAQPVHTWLGQFIPPQTAITLLSTVAGGLVTLTSITFSVLLLAVFQTATAYSGVVVDQFLRRTSNQVYFGFFVGLTCYSFLVLAFAKPEGNPALGAAFALLVGLAALVMLLVLIYRTIDQMRPASVVLSIRDLALKARGEQLQLLARTRSTAQQPADRDVRAVATVHNGYIVRIDVEKLGGALEAAPSEMEVVFHTRVGHHVVYGDTLCDVRGGNEEERRQLAATALSAITLENLPNIDLDPGYAVDQLMNVAWTTGSSSQQNPEAAMTAITTMRDLVTRWTVAGLPDAEDYGDTLPIAYEDGIVAQALGRLASLLVGASAAGQHQTAAHVLQAAAMLLPQLVPEDRAYALDVIERGLPTVAGQVRTHEMDQALRSLRNAVLELDCPDVVESIDKMAATLLTFRAGATGTSPAGVAYRPQDSFSDSSLRPVRVERRRVGAR